MQKMKVFFNTLAKNYRQLLEYMGIPYKSQNRKESVLGTEVIKIGKKWLFLLILQA